MSYDPTTDFLGLLRLTGGGLRSERMPGLDYTIAALARAGLISLSVGQTAPVVNQASTVWFRPASPSWTAEGAVFLWDDGTASYVAATPTLWAALLAGVFPSNDDPLMDGAANSGVSLLYSRSDHVHPTDDTRAPIESPLFIGNPRGPTADLGDSSDSLATTEFVILNGGLPVPIGGMVQYAGLVAPSANWLIPAGQAVSRTGAYTNLFAAIGVTFGSGDGVSTFNLPDMRGRIAAGVDGGANRLTTATMSSQALAGIGGLEAVAILRANLPSINFTNSGISAAISNSAVTIPIHSSTISASNGNQAAQGVQDPQTSLSSDSGAVGVSITNQGSAASGGSGTLLGVVQPTIELNYLIRVI